MSKEKKREYIEKSLVISVLIFLGTLIYLCSVITYGAAVTSSPYTGAGWNTSAPNNEALIGNSYQELQDLRKGVAIRMNKEHETLASSSAGGVHKQGSARMFFQDGAPTTQIDGTAWDSGDRGSMWVDPNESPANEISILTSHASTGTWTPISTEVIAVAVAATHTWADTQTFTKEIDGAGGYDGEVTLGDGNDIVGSATSDVNIANNFTLAGATGNTMARGTLLVGGTLDVNGVIDPTSFDATNGGFLDEDDMASNSATKVASQQSIKAFGTMVPAVTGASAGYGGEESVTFANGLIIKMGTIQEDANPKTVTYGTAFPNGVVSVTGTIIEDSDSAASDEEIRVFGPNTVSFEFRIIGTANKWIYWTSIGY